MKSFTDFYEPPKELATNEILAEDIYDKNALDAFVNNFSSFTDNLKKAEMFVEEFQKLSEQLHSYATKDDLHKVVTGHLLFVNENIKQLKDSLGGLSKKDLDYIQETVKTLSLRVRDILTEINQEVTKNKKIIYDSVTIQQEKIDDISNKLSVVDVDYVEESLLTYKAEIKELAEQTKNQVKILTNKIYEDGVQNFSEIKQIKENLNPLADDVSNLQVRIDSSNEKIEKLEYDLYIESKNLNNKIISSEEKTQGSFTGLANKVNPLIENVEVLKSQVSLVEKTEKQNVKDLKNLSSKLKLLENEIPNQTQKIVGVESSIALVENKIKNIERKDITESLQSKIINVEKLIKGFNKYFDNQNQKISLIEDQIKTTIAEYKNTFNSDKFITINNKLNYLEEILEKFNDKTILNEQSILVAPASTKTIDPLTPLNQNFVTFEQLQKHYQTFIYRVQQQLAAIGGGGAGWLYDLGDVNASSVTTALDGDYFTFDAPNAKWVATTPVFATTAYVNSQISSLIDSAPATLNTLKELADAINDDNNFATTIITQLPTQFSVNNISSATTVYTMNVQAHRGAEFFFTISNGSFHKVVKTLVIHDGSNFSFSDNFLDDNEVSIGTKNTDYTFEKYSGNNNVYLTISPTSGTANVKGKVNLIAL